MIICRLFLRRIKRSSCFICRRRKDKGDKDKDKIRRGERIGVIRWRRIRIMERRLKKKKGKMA